MPTYSDEVNVYNPNAIKDGMVDARDYYVTSVTNDGIWVTPHDKKPVNGAAASTTRGWHIADALEYFRGTVRYIKAWLNGTVPTVRLGQDSSGHADVTSSGLEVFTDASTSVASFGSEARIGDESGNYALIDDDSFDIYHGDTQMAHFGYGEGTSTSGTSNAPYYTLGCRKSNNDIGNYNPNASSYEVGDLVLYNGEGYVCRQAFNGGGTWNSNYWNKITGNLSTCEGNRTIASGYCSHAEGEDSKTVGSYSHAEGSITKAFGYASHAEGLGSLASGDESHAEGRDTEAIGAYSHAQNYHTKAASYNQTAMGRYNVKDASDKYALIIGNGTADDARSNALAVDWNGNIFVNDVSITPIVLFDNDSNALNATVTLSESAANFTRLVICYKTNDNDYSSMEVWHPNGKTIALTTGVVAGTTSRALWVKAKRCKINGTQIATVATVSGSTNYWQTGQSQANGSGSVTVGDYITITQVIGYR